ncbi:MAG TPA: hypothetical protein VF895_07285 [Gaiellaceae bacterium]
MRAIALAAAAAATLVVVYLALGGASYAPAKVADPCVQREWRNPKGVEEVAEQIVLSALDGAACKLGVSREQIVLAFGSRDSLNRFARKHGLSGKQLDELVRSGLVRAVDDAEQAGAISPTTADLVRGVVKRVPVSGLLDLLGQLPGL